MCPVCDSSSFRFFFFKQKTAYEMRISDWSSDVCSSDLSAHRAGNERIDLRVAQPRQGLARALRDGVGAVVRARAIVPMDQVDIALPRILPRRAAPEIGRAHV